MPGHWISPSGRILDQTFRSTSRWKNKRARSYLNHNKDRQERCRNIYLHRFQRAGHITRHDSSDSQCVASVYSQAARQDRTLPWTVSHNELFCKRTPSTQYYVGKMQGKHSRGAVTNWRRTTEDKQFDGRRQWYLYLLCPKRVRSCGDWSATDC